MPNVNFSISPILLVLGSLRPSLCVPLLLMGTVYLFAAPTASVELPNCWVFVTVTVWVIWSIHQASDTRWTWRFIPTLPGAVRPGEGVNKVKSIPGCVRLRLVLRCTC
jgi:hypothetical protein